MAFDAKKWQEMEESGSWHALQIPYFVGDHEIFTDW